MVAEDIDSIDAEFELMPHQKEALQFLGEGKVLYGGVGSGKSAVALAYYIENQASRDLYVITTAKKRDSLEWVGEAAKFGVGEHPDSSVAGVLTVDSFNNLGNYLDVEDAFFIFDEQRLVGTGTWVKNFQKIAKKNRWILLSATPGDTWLDYAPLFIANGFYKNITDFKRQHVLYAPHIRYPMVVGYLGEAKLEKLRNELLVEMPYIKHTTRHINYMPVGYNEKLMEFSIRNRWNWMTNKPIQDMAELFRVMRRIVNTDPSRLHMVKMLLKVHPKLIIFYNFNYELKILRNLRMFGISVGEYNGFKKNAVPETDKWVYLVQYTAGAESWNCVSTNAMVLYSLTYSYKNFEQCQGRIDRLDTPFTDLYYYILESQADVDQGVKRALAAKKNFNERSSDVLRRIEEDFGTFDDVLPYQ